MDNVTHTVVGLLIGEAALALHAARSGGLVDENQRHVFRRAALWVSILANNAPDADFVYSSAISRPLGSLLHHRGHTHTLVLALPLAALVLAVVLGALRRHAFLRERRELGWLAGLALFGNVIHVALDAGNSYGVHPFWPFDNRWVYGDSVFIIEPLIWSALIPPLVFGVTTRTARWLLSAVVVIGVGLSWVPALAPPSTGFLTTLLAVSTALFGRRASAARRALVSGVATIAVISSFAGTGRVADRVGRDVLRESFPAATLHDLVLTPMPANPLCWQAIAVQSEAGRYVARSALIAIAPRFLPAAECPHDSWSVPTADTEPVPAPDRPELEFLRQYSAPEEELATLARENCFFAALLRFARVPYANHSGSEPAVAGDLRYDRSPEVEFAEVDLRVTRPCPTLLPPWTPPRGGLFLPSE